MASCLFRKRAHAGKSVTWLSHSLHACPTLTQYLFTHRLSKYEEENTRTETTPLETVEAARAALGFPPLQVVMEVWSTTRPKRQPKNTSHTCHCLELHRLDCLELHHLDCHLYCPHHEWHCDRYQPASSPISTPLHGREGAYLCPHEARPSYVGEGSQALLDCH